MPQSCGGITGTFMLTTAAPRAGLHVAGGCAWTTSACILDYVEATGIATGLRLTMHQISRVLRQFAVDDASLKDRPIPATIPPGAANRARWIELNLALILQESLSYGMECDRIEAILRQREGGAADVALARGVSR